MNATEIWSNAMEDDIKLLLDSCIALKFVEVAHRTRFRTERIRAETGPLSDDEYHRIWIEEEKSLLRRLGVEFQSLDELRKSVLRDGE
jgi:hypothetical protein